MRTARLAALGLVLAAGALRPVPAHAGDTPPPDAAREAIVAKLDSLRFTCDFSQTPLREVIDFLREYSGINFTYSKEALKVADANPAPEVSFTVENIRFRDALRLILDQFDLTALYKEGVLVISTREEVERTTVTIAYDVRDLLMSIRDFPGPEIGLSQPGQSADTEFIEVADPPVYSDPDALMDLLKKSVAPEAWSSEKATMAYLNGNLVVSASRSVHAELRKLLGMLRQMR